ncbi:hypothetical protein [Streptomyces sp. NPDC093149]|uniref:hypothetical protein n=1 Tax=Streptomyces sp. NPDC093149 TaxID=3366031 RepID=UPI00380C7EEB
MTNPYTYGTQQWREAIEAAESADWDKIDASEQGGELARVVAELYRNDNVDQDEGLLHAAITIAGRESDIFNQEFLEKVVASYTGNAENNPEKVAMDHIQENWPGFPTEAVDLVSFADEYVFGENELFAEDGAGTLRCFDKNKW